MSSQKENNMNEDYGNDILTLVDDDGTEREFELIDRVVTENNEYFALIPTETADNLSDDDGQLVILKVVEDNGEEFLEPIEDDEEFDKIADIFDDEFADIFYDSDEDSDSDAE